MMMTNGSTPYRTYTPEQENLFSQLARTHSIVMRDLGGPQGQVRYELSLLLERLGYSASNTDITHLGLFSDDGSLQLGKYFDIYNEAQRKLNER